MKNKNGFTLIEMLIVIVLMALILTLAIPSVMKLSENRSNTEYKTLRKMIEHAANLYQHRYKGDFDNNPNETCYILDYQRLVDEGLLEEENIKCNGKVYFTKNSKNNYTKDYYLNCANKKNVKFSEYNNSDLPTGCSILGIEVEESTIAAPTIKGGKYDWVFTDIDITVDNSGIDASDVDHYEYYTSNNGITPPRGTGATGTTNNSLTINKEGTTYIWYRVVNKSGEISGWSNRQSANIDKKEPVKPTITASDSINSEDVHTKDFVLTFGGGNNISGNTYYYGTSSTEITNQGSSISVTSADNDKTIYVKSCSGANKCSAASTYVIKY